MPARLMLHVNRPAEQKCCGGAACEACLSALGKDRSTLHKASCKGRTTRQGCSCTCLFWFGFTPCPLQARSSLFIYHKVQLFVIFMEAGCALAGRYTTRASCMHADAAVHLPARNQTIKTAKASARCVTCKAPHPFHAAAIASALVAYSSYNFTQGALSRCYRACPTFPPLSLSLSLYPGN